MDMYATIKNFNIDLNKNLTDEDDEDDDMREKNVMTMSVYFTGSLLLHH